MQHRMQHRQHLGRQWLDAAQTAHAAEVRDAAAVHKTALQEARCASGKDGRQAGFKDSLEDLPYTL